MYQQYRVGITIPLSFKRWGNVQRPDIEPWKVADFEQSVNPDYSPVRGTVQYSICRKLLSTEDEKAVELLILTAIPTAFCYYEKSQRKNSASQKTKNKHTDHVRFSR